ncbi:MAG: ABC transporter permease [Gammaproteobacteria bacterium SG8_47]|nr:MAG: ABC transporter permease [Gammaproteobacteria bacterium SG8_47]
MRANVIAGRELRSLFLSPLAWAILAIVQLIHAYLFLIGVDQYLQIQGQLSMIEGAPGVTDLIIGQLFASAGFILTLVVPLITMRLISEERRARTLTLLFSAPLSAFEIVLGKFLGVCAFLAAMLALLAAMALSLGLGTTLDLGVVASGLLGLALMLMAFAAIGLYLSSVTSYPAVAAISTFGVLLLLKIIDLATSADVTQPGLLSYLSMQHHFNNLLRGSFNSSDVVYYLLLTGLFLALSVRRLEAERLQS